MNILFFVPIQFYSAKLSPVANSYKSSVATFADLTFFCSVATKYFEKMSPLFFVKFSQKFFECHIMSNHEVHEKIFGILKSEISFCVVRVSFL